MVNTHPSIKFAVISLGALLSTLLCFYLMLFLIAQEVPTTIEVAAPTYFRPSITEQEQLEPVATREKPQKILPLQPPPDPNATTMNRMKRVELTSERPTFGSIADKLGPIDIQLDLEAPVSELTPVSVVQPIYPLSAAMREIEGFVIVEFSVRDNGTVANPVVVKSEPSVMFDEAALNAVTRFRFKPREVGGDRVQVDKVQLKFAFNLESLYDIKEQYAK